MKLFELVTEIEILDRELEENGGELTPELEKRLDKLTRNREEMLDWLFNWRCSAKSDLEQAETEKRRIESVRKVRANKVDSIDRKLAMLIKPGQKYRHLRGSVSGKYGSSLRLEHVEITGEWCKQVPDEALIKAALRDGIEVPGAKLEQYETVTVRRNPKAESPGEAED